MVISSKTKAIRKAKRGEHMGIKYITSIEVQNLNVVKLYLDYGIEVIHVQNLPPISFRQRNCSNYRKDGRR